jgi:hypothetical protein
VKGILGKGYAVQSHTLKKSWLHMGVGEEETQVILTFEQFDPPY